ncbi:hypothetical protein HCH_06823 [Hahella chejuensis KCTC 2396]|uniref:Uncharacterized protein n=1 Tax=Hahella chejuensis (strain KCTC 2396) TaxID=349521 RepID=Q2S7C8_HAHCH|nr:hypothetical protein HCH_06823 [Hahella chejuensis KCTC 2396]
MFRSYPLAPTAESPLLDNESGSVLTKIRTGAVIK